MQLAEDSARNLHQERSGASAAASVRGSGSAACKPPAPRKPALAACNATPIQPQGAGIADAGGVHPGSAFADEEAQRQLQEAQAAADKRLAALEQSMQAEMVAQKHALCAQHKQALAAERARLDEAEQKLTSEVQRKVAAATAEQEQFIQQLLADREVLSKQHDARLRELEAQLAQRQSAHDLRGHGNAEAHPVGAHDAGASGVQQLEGTSLQAMSAQPRMSAPPDELQAQLGRATAACQAVQGANIAPVLMVAQRAVADAQGLCEQLHATQVWQAGSSQCNLRQAATCTAV
jgi:exonuclease VII large subunit